MSRKSTDLRDQHGRLVTGYDYDLQAWIEDYLIKQCGYREEFKDWWITSSRRYAQEYDKNTLTV
jgi:hypothetical protein